MKKEHLQTIREALTQLHGEKLQQVTRAGSMASFGFGAYVEKQVHRYNENRVLMAKTITAPQLALHIDCSFRLTCGVDILVSKGDMFQPASIVESEQDFDWDCFDWDVQGKNRFDEAVSRYFCEALGDFVVAKAAIGKWGDLKITFANGFVLETFTDSSGNEECWRFFEIGAETHVVVSGQGLVQDEAVTETQN